MKQCPRCGENIVKEYEEYNCLWCSFYMLLLIDNTLNKKEAVKNELRVKEIKEKVSDEKVSLQI